MHTLSGRSTACAALVGLCAALVAAPASASLIHRFSFDGPTVGDSIGVASGTLVGDASLVGGRLSLDGQGDYVQIDRKVVPIGLTDFSVTLHARQTGVDWSYVEMISQGFSGAPGFYLGHDPSHNFRVGDQFLSTGVAMPNDGEWHYYAVTSGAAGTRLYLDSALVFSSTNRLDTTGTSTGTDTRIGTQFQTFSEFFRGSIDEVRIYDHTLSASEVAATADLPGAVPEPATAAMLVLGLAGIARRRARVTRSR